MLSKEILTQPDAIEVYFCRPFEEMVRSKAIPMNDKTMRLLTSLLFMPQKLDFTDPKMNLIEKNSIGYKIVKNYFEMVVAATVDDDRLILFLAYLCPAPGHCIMLCTYLQYWAKTRDLKNLDLDVFCKEIFPWGFLKRDDIETLWDGQKVDDGSNLLDQGQCAFSIFFM